jgi:SET domain-containing protein
VLVDRGTDEIKRINHACNPNSFVLFSRAGVSMAIKAYRDIEAGEEITISCMPHSLFTPPFPSTYSPC